MIKYAPFDTKQSEYIKKSFNCWLNVLEGGKRAGKNIINIVAFAENLETHPDKLHLAGGVTKATVMMNIMDSNGFGLEHYFEGRCSYGKYPKSSSKGVDCLYIQTQVGEKIVVIAGGSDSDDYRRIKGFSLGSVYLTEGNECHETFVKECFDRTMASSNRKIFMDLNPKPPRHWFYVEILDHHDNIIANDPTYEYNFSHFTIWNNLSITSKQLKTILRTYDKTSMWYRADILGERTAGTGRIYVGYKYTDIAASPEEIRQLGLLHFSVGVDVGGTDATVATFTGMSRGFKNTCLIDGYYHKQGKESGMTHDKYAKAIFNKIEEWIDTYPLAERLTIFVESADKLFRQALENERKKRNLVSIRILPSYKKDGILDRIRLNQILINQGRFRIARHLLHWFEAYENATWDDEEYEKGEYVRVDDGSYPVDCLDSTEYSIQPFKPDLIKGGH